MSVRNEYVMSLAGVNISAMSYDELVDLFKNVLKGGMHGLCISPYTEGQKPGDQLSEEQVRRRLNIIRPYIKWVRTFSCTEGNEMIPVIAKELGIKTLVGGWLGKDKDINRREIEGLVELAHKGYADIIAVGNEVLYRKDLSEEELLFHINQVKGSVKNIPVGYVDAYYEFENCPAITEACDVILANCYPFWEGCSLEYSLLYMKDMYRRAVKAGNGKRVIITETGWPSTGKSFHGAQPSEQNALKYFIDAQKWSREDDIEIFYFSSFDESWKTGTEGDVGAYWGLWDKDEQLKYW
ncbi:glycosyl hydrolase family 17 protein [Carboxylicivirga sp. RSCT41]|uniref:glycoside hydrolase family 17 protein n=1 Tax=Carboxylicivirga agarovorans TaxID=3417570 RepID=UPI003D349847